jgi:hypothetical protein
MKAKCSQQLYGYWNELRAGRLAPRRFEVEPSSIASLLPDTFILEREDRHQYMFRLAGTRICESFDREFRGYNLLDLWTQEDREVMVRLLEGVSRDGGVGLAGVMTDSLTPHAAAFELLLLPLLHTGQSISRILGAFAPIADVPGFRLHPIRAVEIASFEVIWPDGRPYALVSRQDSPAPFLREDGVKRIVRSDRRAFRVYDGGLKDGPVVGRPLPGK